MIVDAAAWLPRFAAWAESQGEVGLAVFIMAYVLASLAFLPGSLLSIAAGVIYGIGPGTAVAWVGATLGSTAAFLVSRHVARSSVERRLRLRPAFQAIDRAIGERGFMVVLLLRLSPVFPYNLLNYALGITAVRLRDFVAASVGMIPGTLLFVYAGRVAGEVATALSDVGQRRGTGEWIVLALGFTATVAVVALVTRLAREALREI